MDIEKGNNQTVDNYHIISVGYKALTIAPTNSQPEMTLEINDYWYKSSIEMSETEGS